ncbi:Cysteine/Histidine-rich C1 domain family protein [Fagus crenata]
MTNFNQISHFNHPNHTLKLEYSEIPFKCDGCKEVGIGSHYKCAICDFDLHIHCANYSPTIFHPYYPKWTFQFLSSLPGNMPRYCNGCEKDVIMFVYHCYKCGYNLHPCCAKLLTSLHDGEVNLYLYKKVSAPCHKCGRKGRSWSYRSKCKKYNLHDIYVGRGERRILSETRIPSLKNTLCTRHHKSKAGKVLEFCKIAGLAMRTIISLGDPFARLLELLGP